MTGIDKKLIRLILLAIVVFILGYGLLWLPDEIYLTIGFLTFGFIIWGVPILIIFVLVKSIMYFFETSNVMGGGPVGILVITIYLFLFMNPTVLKRERNYVLTIAQRNEVVQLIKDGKLERDSNNYVLLTDEYRKLSEAPYVYVPELGEEELLVGFVYEAGFPDEDLWLVYSNGGEELITSHIDDPLYSKIWQQEENWYFVQFN